MSTTKPYYVELFSNNGNISIEEYIEATDTADAIAKAKQLQAAVNATGGGIPNDFRVKTLRATIARAIQ